MKKKCLINNRTETLWAVLVVDADHYWALPDKATAEQYAQLLTDRYHADCLAGHSVHTMHARVVPSPWSEVEHWKQCAITQSHWVKNLQNELQEMVNGARPPAYLIPNTEIMTSAWSGSDNETESVLPDAIRNYTMQLMSSLPSLRPLPKDVKPEPPMLAAITDPFS